MLGEEVGELFKAVRKERKMSVDAKSKIGSCGEELADVFIFLCAIANRLEIDLETAFREKEERNKTRVWTSASAASRPASHAAGAGAAAEPPSPGDNPASGNC